MAEKGASDFANSANVESMYRRRDKVAVKAKMELAGYVFGKMKP